MANIIGTVNQVLTFIDSDYLSHPANAGLDRNGFWFKYHPNNGLANNQLFASIVPYRWDSALSINSVDSNLTIDGTIPLIMQPLGADSSTVYHGSSMIHIGAGINDITQTVEDDAMFFSHLGSLNTSPDDDGFYWDRLYLTQGGTEWDYYQYHLHLPSFYPQYEQGRLTLSAIDYINPDDKAYGYTIPIRIKSGANFYQSILARIHTPSVGGAHNSHNDVTLPTTTAKNYQMGGIIKGAGNTFHAFYIAANGGNWDLFSRTFIAASASFTTEINLGTYNFADPNLNLNTSAVGTNDGYPVRASTGEFLNGRIYFPVVMNDSVSGYDLEVWSFTSASSLSSSTLTRSLLLKGQPNKPDAHITAVGGELHLAASAQNIGNGIGGVCFFSLESDGWQISDSCIVTNGVNNPLRLHGLRYNSEDVNYYVIISGEADSGSYAGPGVYSFNLVGDFAGYTHYSYDYTNYSLVRKQALETGYLKYNTTNGVIQFIDSPEPEGIVSGEQILIPEAPSPSFFNKTVIDNDGDTEKYYYQSILLDDNRKFLVGRIETSSSGGGEQSDLLISLVNQDNTKQYHFCYGGAEYDGALTGGNDYITGAYQSNYDPDNIWITGYTKSELIERKDILIHGYTRRITDAPNNLKHIDIAKDSVGNIYILCTNEVDGVALFIKYDYNYELQWQRTVLWDDTFNSVALAVDSEDKFYVLGTLFENGVAITKFDTEGDEVWSYAYTKSGVDQASGLSIINDGSNEYLVISVEDGPYFTTTTTTFISLDTDGNILAESEAPSLFVNKLRPFQSEPDKLLFAGYELTEGETYNIINAGLNDYLWNGGIYTNATDPSPITLYRNTVYTFNINASGHPFWIKTVNSTGTGNAYNDGVTNNGTAVGTITFEVPSDAPDTLYYNCQYHAGMAGTFSVQDNPTTGRFGMLDLTNAQVPTVRWVANFANEAVDIANLNSSASPSFAIACNSGSDGTLLRVGVSQSGSNYTVSKTWARIVTDCRFNAILTSPYSEANRYIYLAGRMEDTGTTEITNGGCLLIKYDDDGSLLWQNAYGHMSSDEEFVNLTWDMYDRNIFTVGYSSSHSSAIDGIFFRFAPNGFGTGTYHLAGNPGMPYYYLASSLTEGNNSSSITQVAASSNYVEKHSIDTGITMIYDIGGGTNQVFDGSYGPNGVFMLFYGYIKLSEIQTYLNSVEYKQSVAAGNTVHASAGLFTHLFQIATVGDGSADDGNVFGYDIIESSNNLIYVACQTSGNVSATNAGASGVYDVLGIEYFQVPYSYHPAGDVSYYQAGDELDEEIYALTEMANGKIAFVGRTAGEIGGTNYGGYDILLGIYNPVDDSIVWDQIGSGLNDKAMNVHDIGNNLLALVYSSYGALGDQINNGTEDIGVILYDYSTSSWSYAYQTGTSGADLFDQNGKVSALMGDGRIAIGFSTGGNFNAADPNSANQGFLDFAVAILDLQKDSDGSFTGVGTFSKGQVGSQTNEICTSISANGEQLLISGYIPDTFDGQAHGIFVECDASRVIKSISRTDNL